MVQILGPTCSKFSTLDIGELPCPTMQSQPNSDSKKNPHFHDPKTTFEKGNPLPHVHITAKSRTHHQSANQSSVPTVVWSSGMTSRCGWRTLSCPDPDPRQPGFDSQYRQVICDFFFCTFFGMEMVQPSTFAVDHCMVGCAAFLHHVF